MKILISTGDLSGDFIGSLLVKELKALAPETVFYGVGGQHLRDAGVQMLEDSTKWSAIGIFDALSKVPTVYLAYRRIKKIIPKLELNGIVFLDCPAVNMLLAKSILKLQIPSVYFFPPSAWRNDPARAFRVGKLVSKVIAPFRQSEALYKGAGVPTYFSGHPLLDIIPKSIDKEKAISELGLDSKRPVVGLFPGSRTQELKYLLPGMLKTANRLYLEDPSIQFALALAHLELEEKVTAALKAVNLPVVLWPRMRDMPDQDTLRPKGVLIGHVPQYTIMQAADVLLLASGTATLEAALMEKPMVIVYKVSEWSWRLEGPFLKGISFAGLPNLLAGKEIVPELIQRRATPEKIEEALKVLLYPCEERTKMIENLKMIKPSLGEPGAVKRAAKAVMETFHV